MPSYVIGLWAFLLTWSELQRYDLNGADPAPVRKSSREKTKRRRMMDEEDEYKRQEFEMENGREMFQFAG